MSDSNGGFVFSLDGVGAVLKSNRLLVPSHQREYSWTKDKVRQMLTDFSEAKSQNKDHFLGTIVTIKETDGNELKIVDGQQRLTTTALLIAAIRNHLKNDDSASLIVDSINNEFLSIIDRKARTRVPRLALNIDDNEFFRQLISSEGNFKQLAPMRESHDLLLDAAKAAAAWVVDVVSAFAPSDTADRLNDWLEFIEYKATAVLLQVSDGSRAFKMFETLNDRGLRTSQADLVKSFLFGESGNRVSEAQARWSSMRENLQEIDDDDRAINFLRHSLIATRKFVRADQVYDAVSGSVRGNSNAVEYLSELESLSRAYASTFNADSDLWKNHSETTKKAIRTYNTFDPKPIRPLLLTIALKFTPKECEAAIKLLLSMAVRAVITSQTRSGVIEQAYAHAALSVYRQEAKTATSLKSLLENILILDDDFKAAFSSARSSKPALARYYLHSLELAHKNEPEPWYIPNDDPAVLTLEHILPQNPKTGSWTNFDEESRRRAVKRLGNMCLLQRSINSNKDNTFQASKQLYAESPFGLTSMVGTQFDDWDIEAIDKRQTRMAQLAVKAWPI